MDGKLWDKVYQVLFALEHPKSSPSFTHEDRTIVLILLRAAADDRPVSWACRLENWQGLRRPPSWPSQPTVSRRQRSPGVRQLFLKMYDWLKTRPANRDRVVKLDGRALTINPFTKDRDARWGYAIRGFGIGYKLHVAWGNAPVPTAWELQPLNVSEPGVAAQQLVPALPMVQGAHYLLGDSAYDSNPLYGAAAQRGYQLLALPKREGRGLGHRRHHAARLVGLARLKTAYGQRLYRRRAEVDREFGHCAMRAEGLDELPAHVRRIERVRQFVHSKLILNGFRILHNRNALQPSHS